MHHQYLLKVASLMIIQCWANKPHRSPGHSTCIIQHACMITAKYIAAWPKLKIYFHIEQQALACLHVLHMYVGSPKSHD